MASTIEILLRMQSNAQAVLDADSKAINGVAEAAAQADAPLANLEGDLKAIGLASLSAKDQLDLIAKAQAQVSGQDSINRTEAYVRAVQGLGGVSKLTADEQDKLAKSVQQALDKYTALGRQAPQDLQNIADKLKPVEQNTTLAGRATDLFAGSFGRLVGAFSAATIIDRVISGLIGFGKEAFASAGRIEDLAAKTGLSMDAIQRMAFVADQTGSNLNTFTDAAFKLGTTIAGGGTSVVKSLEALGLSYATIRGLKPEAMFDAVVDSLGRMTDPLERNRLGQELFGRAFKDLAPAIEQGYKKIADQAKVSSDEQIKAVGAAGDAWDAFIANTKTRTLTFIGQMVLMTDAAKKFGAEAFAESDESNAALAALEKNLNDTYGAAAKLADVPSPFVAFAADAKAADVSGLLKGLPADLNAIEGALIRQHAAQVNAVKAAKDAAEAAKVATAVYGDWRDEMRQDEAAALQMNDAVGKSVDMFLQLGRLPPGILGGIDLDATAKGIGDLAGNVGTLTTTASESSIQAGLLVGAYRDFGLQAPEQLRAVADAAVIHFEALRDSGTATPQQIQIAFEQMKDAVLAVNGEIPTQWETEILPRITSALSGMQGAFSGWASDVLAGTISLKGGLQGLWGDIKQSFFDTLGSMLSHFTNTFLRGLLNAVTGAQGGFAGAFAGLFGGGGGGGAGGLLGGLLGGAGGGGNFGGLAGAGLGLGGLFGGGGGVLASTSLGTLGGGAGAAGGIAGLGISTAATAGIAAAVAGAVALGFGIWKKGLFRGGEEALKVNPERDVYLASQGGFGGLSDKLNQATGSDAETERLRKALFDADTVKEYEAAVDNINEALERFRVTQDEAAVASKVAAAEAMRAAHETVLVAQANVTAIEGTLQGLADQRAAIFETIKDEAPEDEIGRVEELAREQMAVLAEQQAAAQTQLAAAQQELQRATAEEAALAEAGMADVETSVSDVAGRLSTNQSEWKSWADTVVSEADRAQQAVDRVTFGSSPGGMKEWSPMLEGAKDRFRAFADEAVDDTRRVVAETMRIIGLNDDSPGDKRRLGRLPALSSSSYTPVSAAHAGAVYNITLNITGVDPTNKEQVSTNMREVFAQLFGQNGLIERNEDGSRTQARQSLRIKPGS